MLKPFTEFTESNQHHLNPRHDNLGCESMIPNSAKEITDSFSFTLASLLLWRLL